MEKVSSTAAAVDPIAEAVRGLAADRSALVRDALDSMVAGQTKSIAQREPEKDPIRLIDARIDSLISAWCGVQFAMRTERT
jgi:hypothetical protein